MAPSDIYTFDALAESVAFAYDVGYSGKRFYLGPPPDSQSMPDLSYGWVNLAAFLAQSQSESILANSCDEYHQDSIDGLYPISNSCGQFGNDYQSYTCSSGADKAMECSVTSDMKVKASVSGKYADSLYEWYDFRPNFYCGPDEEYTGAYDPGTKVFQEGPFANRAGRKDVRGCCFWGRGALMTRGICMMGKWNYYLGKRAADEGRPSLYPDIDFCLNPAAVCDNFGRHPTIVWDVALFEWIERIQSNSDTFNYLEKLHEFVDGGFQDDSFILAVSRLVSSQTE
jgi:hypothetical protein